MPDWPWDKNRIQDQPAPGEAGGGSDQELDVARRAVADAEAELEPYVPPFPVPLSRPIQRQPGQRGLRSAVWLVNPTTRANTGQVGNLVGGGVADAGEDFPINSIMVDNATVAWAYWPEVGVFVPPFNIGRVFRFDGSRRKRVLFEQPAGLSTSVAVSTSLGALQTLRVVFHEELLPETAGFVVPSTNQ